MSNFVLPVIFKDPIHILEMKRQPRKAIRVIKLVRDEKYKHFLLDIFKSIMKSN